MEEILLNCIKEEKQINAIEQLSEPDAVSFLEIAERAKVAPYICRAARNAGVSRSPFVKYEEQHRERVVKHVDLIKSIMSSCWTDGLRVACIKGVALGWFLYGDYSSRQLGDVDLLVDARQLLWLDRLLRGKGLFQPDATIGASLESRRVARFLQAKSKTSTPFPMKRKSYDNQLMPYYYSDDLIRVEVHDGLRCYSAKALKNALWKLVDNGDGVKSLNAPNAFLNLVLSTYENSESYYASIDGELNLRDFLDIRQMTQTREEQICCREVRRMVGEGAFECVFAAVADNYEDVFGCRNRVLDNLSKGFVANHRYSEPFTKRLFGGSLSAREADDALRKRYRELMRVGDLAVIESNKTGWQAYRNDYGIELLYCVALSAGGITFGWRISSYCDDDGSSMGFRVAITPVRDSPYLQYGVCMAIDGSELKVVPFKSRRLGQQFFSNQKGGAVRGVVERRGRLTQVTAFVPYADLGFQSCYAESGLALFSSVFIKTSKTIYHSLVPDVGDLTIPKCFIKAG